MSQSFAVRIVGPARHQSPDDLCFEVYGLRSRRLCGLRRTRDGWLTRTYRENAWRDWQGPYSTAHAALRIEGPLGLDEVVFTLLAAEALSAGDLGRIASVGVVRLASPFDANARSLAVRALGPVPAWSHGAFEEVTPAGVH